MGFFSKIHKKLFYFHCPICKQQIMNTQGIVTEKGAMCENCYNQQLVDNRQKQTTLQMNRVQQETQQMKTVVKDVMEETILDYFPTSNKKRCAFQYCPQTPDKSIIESPRQYLDYRLQLCTYHYNWLFKEKNKDES